MKRWKTSTRAAAITMAAVAGCATSQFDRYLSQQRWDDAARTFAADSSLLNDEHVLYEAAVLYGTPGRPTFNADHSRSLLRRLLSRFPESKHRAQAAERLALLDEVARAERDAESRARGLNAQIDSLTTETQQLRARLDSIGNQTEQLRRAAARAEAELREREEQLRTLRLELQRLKEIDLKPRPPAGAIKP